MSASAIHLAMARAALVASGHVIIPQALLDDMRALIAKRSATQAEVDLIESELRACPGYNEFVAREMLNDTLKKALA
jgi:hypothetical protein